jgi:general secretion pathway protein E
VAQVVASSKASALAIEEPRAAFGQHLLNNGKITPDALARAEQISAESRERFELVLTRLGIISERDLAEALAGFLTLPLASLQDYPSSPVLEDKFSNKFLREAQFIPLEERKDGVAIALANPLDEYTSEAIRFAIGKPLIRYVSYPSDLEAAFLRLYGEDKSDKGRLLEAARDRADEGLSDDLDRLKDIASEAPIIKLVNQLIARAVEIRASDIHIEPMENELRVRYRIDGVLQKVESPPQQLSSAVISRIKIMTKLNIAERRLAQDGRIGMAVRGKDIDLRVSTTPTIHGESVVLRILDRGHIELNFAALGFEDDIVETLRTLLEQPHGILLVTGPTGSGKTTTLYAALVELNTIAKKILTIEDPVEYHLDGINQVQVKPQIGLTFASALRSFLRQDPDIMMIGEIRDLETAQIAVQAALTGHLILSTLHTNDAASAVTRLIDMGVEDYLLTSTVNGVAAQRLVRTLCPNCREPFELLAELHEKFGLPPELLDAKIQLYRAKGCEQCSNTGYRGRTSIIEILPISDPIRQAVLKSTDAAAIDRIARDMGMQTMRMHGVKKALAGITTIEEVMRVTRAV